MSLDNTAHYSLETLGGRVLRVARWRWDQPGAHLPILFFNGIGANIEAVAPLAEALSERPFIMFDMPGVGGSPEPLIPYNPFTMSWIASELLRRFGVAQVDVMGISWGGAMAQHFTLQHGSRVRRLVLAATTAGMVMVPGDPAALTKMANPRRYTDTEYMQRHFRSLYGGLTEGKQEHISRLTPPTPRGYLYQILCMLGWTSAPALPFLKKEVLIMMGEEDKVVPPVNGRILERLIPGSQLEMFAQGGHLFVLTHREQTLTVLRRFLDAPDREQREAA